METLIINSNIEGHEIKIFNLNQINENSLTYNPFAEATKNANSIEEKELALRKFLVQLGEYAPEYARQRLLDMSFLDDCPDWKEKAIAILRKCATL